MLRRTVIACAVLCAILAGAACSNGVEGTPQIGGAVAALTASDCPAGYNIIQGTNAAETLTGTAGNDCIVGKGGNDTVFGRGGNDFLIGGDGNDTLHGEAGNDTLYGESGTDRLEGGDGNDVLWGGLNVDNLYGQNGDDQLYGEAAGDTLEGGLGKDVLRGGDGDDTLRGGDDDDRLLGEAGVDNLYGEAGRDVLHGGTQADNIWGGDGDDIVQGFDGNDVLNGEAGDDAVIGGLGTNTINGGAGVDACSGTGCEKPALTPTGCTADAQCSGGQRCIVDVGLCLLCVSDQDGDGVCDSQDACATDGNKSAPGVCGCGVADTDSDGDGTPNCHDGCPSDATKVAAGVCGCGVADTDGDGDGAPNCSDGCPSDANKNTPGVCGCGVADTDSDGDGAPNCHDGCPSDANKNTPGACGCGVADTDSDGDGTPNCHDGCPSDATKVAAGVCGCGVADTDSDNDGTANCNDACPNDAAKTAAGVCGCGVADTDSDSDGTANCNDACPNDAAKTVAGACGCGVADTDSDSDNRPDCTDVCAGFDDSQDSDGDGTPDGCDEPTECNELTVGAHTYYGDAYVQTAADLAALQGVVCITGSLYVNGSELTNLVGLESLFGVGGYVQITYNQQLTALDGLDALRSVGNALGISGNPALEDLLALGSLTSVGGDLYIFGNPLLGSVDGLESLTSIGFDLSIFDNVSLANLNGLSNLEELGALQMDSALHITNNPQLPQCWVWMLEQQLGVMCGDGSQYCAGNTGAGTCGTLPPDFDCVPGAIGPGVYDGYLSVYNADQLAVLSGLSCVTEGLSINYPQSSDLSVLSNLRAVGGYLNIYGSATLTSLHGLENLRSVGYGITILGNSQLSSLSALSGVTSVGARLFEIGGTNALAIQSNLSLPACNTWQFAQQLGYTCGTDQARCTGNTGTGSCGTLPPGFACAPGAVGPGVYDGWIDVSPWSMGPQLNEFGGLTCLTGDLRVHDSSVSDLSVLSSLQQVGGSVWLYSNQQLTSLAGLESLESIGRSLDISSNGALTSLSALSSLTSVGAGPDSTGALNATNNTVLPQCSVWALEQQLGTRCGWGNPETGFYECRGNRGQGSCGALPADFACVPGATGPGVYDGSLYNTPWQTNGLQLDELGGLTCVTGDFYINQTSATDLSTLSRLQKIGGSLFIGGNSSLVSLTGLEQLTSVGTHVDISYNAALSDLAPLASLTSIADAPNNPPGTVLMISNNASLPACWAWSVAGRTGERCGQQDWNTNGWLECRGNTGQGSCGALPADFACVPGAMGPGVYDGSLYNTPWQTNGLQLDELGGLTCVTGDFYINQTSATDLSTLSGLQKIGGSLFIGANSSLVSLTGLEQLTSVGTHVNISYNPELTSLAALASLTSIADAPNHPPGTVLMISNNANLAACWAWSVAGRTGERCGQQDWNSGAWLECRGNKGYVSCGSLPADFACEPGATGPGVYDGSLYIAPSNPNGPQLDELGGLTCVTGDLYITGTDAAYLSDLQYLQEVGGSLFVSDNQSLVTLGGLQQLASVGGHVNISYNNALSELDALESLTSIGDGLVINNNLSLSACAPTAVATRAGVQCGWPDGNGGWLECAGNLGAGECISGLPPDFTCVPGATGPGVYDGTLDLSSMYPNGAPSGAFGGVQCVTGDLILSQTALVDLTPLSHLQMVGGHVAITDNTNLTSIAGLAQLTLIGGTLDIANNPELRDLAPLAQLTSLAHAPSTPPESGVLHVVDNDSLPGCWAWMIADQTGQRCGHPNGESSWSECRGNTGEGSCGELPDDFVCELQARGPGVYPGTVFVASSPENGWTLDELGGVTCVTGSVVINDPYLQDLQGAWDLRAVGIALGIHDCPALVSLVGLEHLEYVGASLGIWNNAALSDLSALSNLSNLAERADSIYGMNKLSVNDNPSLPACWEAALEEQTGLECGQTDWDDNWTDCSGNTGAGTCE